MSDCTVFPINLIQTSPNTTDTLVTEALAFQAETYLGVGGADGDYIDRMEMRILNDEGTSVYQYTEDTAIYCAFTDSGGVCQNWNFADNDYEWPDGALIENGPHTLQVETFPDNGNSKTANFPIDIQLPIVTNLAQTGPDTTTSVVTEALVFQLEAHVGPRHSDSQDIDNVVMSVLDPNGTKVYERTEGNAKYCAFTGGGSGNPNCVSHNFADNNYQWPDGQPIENGPHTLRATVNTTDGRSEVVEFPIQIQLPLVTNLIQTDPGNTNTVISDTLVFQVETFVGPNNGDGDDIDSVEMSILNAGDVAVHTQTDSQAKYCAFGGGDPACNAWVFADHDDQWPAGQAAENGPHTLRAVINTSDGRNETVEYGIDLQLPNVEPQKMFVYLPAILK